MGCQSSKNTGEKKKKNPIGKHIDFIRTGNLNALKKLENAGDVSLDRDENGDTLLHHAAKLNRVAVANYLLQF